MRGRWALARPTAFVAACAVASVLVTAGAASAATKGFRIYNLTGKPLTVTRVDTYGKSYRDVFAYLPNGARWYPGDPAVPLPPREGWGLTPTGPTLHVELEY